MTDAQTELPKKKKSGLAVDLRGFLRGVKLPRKGTVDRELYDKLHEVVKDYVSA